MGRRGRYRGSFFSSGTVNSARTIFAIEAPAAMDVVIRRTNYTNGNDTTNAQYRGYWCLITDIGSPTWETSPAIPVPFDDGDQACSSDCHFNNSGTEPTYDTDYIYGALGFNHLAGYRLAEYDDGLFIARATKWGFLIDSTGTIPAHTSVFEVEFEEMG